MFGFSSCCYAVTFVHLTGLGWSWSQKCTPHPLKRICDVSEKQNSFPSPLCATNGYYDAMSQSYNGGRTNIDKNNKPINMGLNEQSSTNECNKPSIIVRRSTWADLEPVASIMAYVFSKNRKFLELSLVTTFPDWTEYHGFFVACDSRTGKVVGCVELDARTSKSSVRRTLNSHNRGGRPYMCNLAVLQSYRRHGIGSALVRECEALVQQWHTESHGAIPDELCLRVEQSANLAVSFYEKYGYQSYCQEVGPNGRILLWMGKFIRLPVANVSSDGHHEHNSANNFAADINPRQNTGRTTSNPNGVLLRSLKQTLYAINRSTKARNNSVEDNLSDSEREEKYKRLRMDLRQYLES